MFDLSNITLPAFWAFWGIPVVAWAVAVGALFFTVEIAWSPALKRLGVEVAAIALAFSAVYEWGGEKRDALAAAQLQAAESRFERLQDSYNQLTAKQEQELSAKIAEREQVNAAERKKIVDRLEASERGTCLPSDEFLGGMREHRASRATRKRAEEAAR